MVRGESESRGGLPKVPAEDVRRATFAIGPRILEKDRFTEEVYEGVMGETDPGLRYGLQLHEEYRRQVFSGDNENIPKVHFGSAYMYSVMDELRTDGYALPVVEGATAEADNAQTLNRFMENWKVILERDAKDDLDEILQITEQTASRKGINIFTSEQLLEENPGFTDMVEGMDSHEQEGARYVYKMFKKQQEVNTIKDLYAGDGTDTGTE
jgi:hypothetical protein